MDECNHSNIEIVENIAIIRKFIIRRDKLDNIKDIGETGINSFYCLDCGEKESYPVNDTPEWIIKWIASKG